MLLLQPLREDLQVQQATEPRSPPLAQRGTAVRPHSHTGVVEGELGHGRTQGLIVIGVSGEDPSKHLGVGTHTTLP